MTYEDLFNLIYSTRISESLKGTILLQYCCPIEEAVEEVNPYIEFLDTLVNSSISEDLLYSIIDETFSTLDEEVINEVSDRWIKDKVDKAVKKAHAGTKDAVGLNAFRNYDKTMDKAERITAKAANRTTYSTPKASTGSTGPKDPIGLSSFRKHDQAINNTGNASTNIPSIKDGALGKLKSAVGKVFNKTRAERDLRPKDIQPHLAKLKVQDRPEVVGQAPKAEKPKVEKVVKAPKAPKAEKPKVEKTVKVTKAPSADKVKEPKVEKVAKPAATKKTTVAKEVKVEKPKTTAQASANKVKTTAKTITSKKATPSSVKVEKPVQTKLNLETPKVENTSVTTEAPKVEVKKEKKVTTNKTPKLATEKKVTTNKVTTAKIKAPKVETKKTEAKATENKSSNKSTEVYIKPGQLSVPNTGKINAYKKLDKIDQEIKKGEEQATRKTSGSKLSDKDRYEAQLRRQRKQEQENQKKALENLRQQRASLTSKPGYSNKSVTDLDKRIADLEKELATSANESLAEALYLIATTNISESAYVQIAELLAATPKNVEKVRKAREQAVYNAVDRMEKDILAHRMNKETARGAEDAEKRREKFDELYRKRFKDN